MPKDSGTTHHLIVGTFRHPYLFTLEFSTDRPSNALKIVSKHTATGGHSWLHLDDAKKVLYCTGWTQPPSLAAYRIQETGDPSGPISLRLLNQAYPKYLSGYVTVDDKALYSASGPQGDVFALNTTTGGFASEKGHNGREGEVTADGPIQSFSFLSPAEQEAIERGENIGNIMDFGGLRHGGHSADLSPDGQRLYVADIGRNAIWTYLVNDNLPSSSLSSSSQRLTLGCKTISKRANDGPRHVWPCQVGGGKNRIVYVVQEHSSYVDVFEHVKGDDGEIRPELVWRQGANILPDGVDCDLYWADEVRTSPAGDVLFASTRGLKPTEKGYIIALPLDPTTGLISGNPHVNASSGNEEHTPLHRWQTPTSGGWANAIAVCPTVGPKGQVWISLTDSEEGWVWMLQWTMTGGFEVVGSVNLNDDEDVWQKDDKRKGEEVVGASVTVWYD